jgi:small subunit ribosomal protein S21
LIFQEKRLFLHRNSKFKQHHLTKEVFFMIIIPVKEGENIDKALKKFKRKFEKTGVVKELRERQKYTKPSIKNREMKLKAIYIQQLRDAEQV